MPRFPSHHWSRTYARRLRRSMTPEERLLWVVLRNDFEHKFRRQEPLGRYIADFVCYSHRLVVEVDGSQHIGNRYDERRDAFLRSIGFEVLRFSTFAVNQRLQDVKRTIGSVLDARQGEETPSVAAADGDATSP